MRGRGGGFEDARGPVPVRRHELGQVAGGDPSRQVIDDLGIGTALAQSVGGVQVTPHDPYRPPPQGLGLGGRTHQTRHPVAAGLEGAHQVSADETGAPGDEDVHRDRS